MENSFLLPVKVVLRGHRTEILGWKEGELRIRLCNPPVDNAANEELIAFIAKHLHISKSCVTLQSGDKNLHKKLLITGVDPLNIKGLLGMA